MSFGTNTFTSTNIALKILVNEVKAKIGHLHLPDGKGGTISRSSSSSNNNTAEVHLSDTLIGRLF